MIKLSKQIWLLVALLFVLSAGVTVVYLYSQLGLRDKENSLQSQSTALPGTFTLSTDSQSNSYTTGQDVYVVLGADSTDIPISGFDGVITYDPTILTYVDTQNGMDDYDLFPIDKTGTLTLTGSLTLSQSTAPVLVNAVLATVQFKTLKEGNSAVQLTFTPGSTTDSNMLSDKTQDILGTVEGITIYVGNTVTVSAGSPTTVDGKKFTLLEASIPDANCADCQSVVRVSIEENGETVILTYKNGGFEGLVEREKVIGNTMYYLDQMSSTRITLIVSEK